MEKEKKNYDEIVKRIYNKKTTDLTLQELMILMITDIDIFLLKQENQIDDKDINFSVEDVRNQLKMTLAKFIGLYNEDHYTILNTPLYKACKLYQVETNCILSENEKKDIISTLLKIEI